MKREEKNTLSRQRILEAAMQEFSAKGYEASSLNTICTKHEISKGIIYHYFKDKDELYLLCVQECFDAITAYMEKSLSALTGSADEKLQSYFHARLHFFVNNPLYLGIFTDAALLPPPALTNKIALCRKEFDSLNISILTSLLTSEPLRDGLKVSQLVEDFRRYMDYFNMRFKEALQGKVSPEAALKEHEERCHRQLDILLHGVIQGKESI